VLLLTNYQTNIVFIKKSQFNFKMQPEIVTIRRQGRILFGVRPQDLSYELKSAPIEFDVEVFLSDTGRVVVHYAGFYQKKMI